MCEGSAEAVMTMRENLSASLGRALAGAEVPRFLDWRAALGIRPRACRPQGAWVPLRLFVVQASGAARAAGQLRAAQRCLGCRHSAESPPGLGSHAPVGCACSGTAPKVQRRDQPGAPSEAAAAASHEASLQPPTADAWLYAPGREVLQAVRPLPVHEAGVQPQVALTLGAALRELLPALLQGQPAGPSAATSLQAASSRRWALALSCCRV